MKHVKSQLASYTEGLLTPKQARQVQDHLAICANCRNALINHEQIGRDLRFTLAVSPRPEQINRWWGAIETARRAVPMPLHQPAWSSTAMIPTLLAVGIIVLPMLIGLTGQSNRTALAAGTYNAPAAVVTNVPPTERLSQTHEPIQSETAVLVELTSAQTLLHDPQSTEVPILVIPAPLAP